MKVKMPLTTTEQDTPQGGFPPHFLFDQLNHLDSFSGEDPRANVKEFIEKLEKAAAYLSWNEEDRIMALSIKLKGDARAILKEKSNPTFADIRQTLLERYAEAEHSDTTAHQKFIAFHHLPYMSVSQYLSKLESLSYALFDRDDLGKQETEKLRLKMLKSTALANIRPEIRKGVISRNPQNYAELKKFAILEEKGLMSVASKPFLSEVAINPAPVCHVRVEQDAAVEELRNQVQNLQLQMAELLAISRENKNPQTVNPSPVNAQNQGQRQTYKCQLCQKIGHTALYCRTLGNWRNQSQDRPQRYNHNYRQANATRDSNFAVNANPPSNQQNASGN